MKSAKPIRALALALTLLTVAPLHAADKAAPPVAQQALGMANRLSCARWQTAREEPGNAAAKAADAWLRGYFSGFNMLSPKPKRLFSYDDMAAIDKQIAAFCTLQPAARLSAAAFAAYLHFEQNPAPKTCACQNEKARDDGALVLVENSNRSCMVWQQKLDAGDYTALHHFNEYIFGFFSAYNQFTEKPARQFIRTDEKSLLAAVIEGCSGQPLDHIAKAMLRFIRQLETHAKKAHSPKSAKSGELR